MRKIHPEDETILRFKRCFWVWSFGLTYNVSPGSSPFRLLAALSGEEEEEKEQERKEEALVPRRLVLPASALLCGSSGWVSLHRTIP